MIACVLAEIVESLEVIGFVKPIEFVVLVEFVELRGYDLTPPKSRLVRTLRSLDERSVIGLASF